MGVRQDHCFSIRCNGDEDSIEEGPQFVCVTCFPLHIMKHLCPNTFYVFHEQEYGRDLGVITV